MSKKSKGEIIEEIINRQLNSFAEKYGRAPDAEDPLFFDFDEEVPISYSVENLRERLIHVGIQSGVDPALVLLQFGLPTSEGKA